MARGTERPEIVAQMKRNEMFIQVWLHSLFYCSGADQVKWHCRDGSYHLTLAYDKRNEYVGQ